MVLSEVGRPTTEVAEKAKRRTFTAEYKSRIVREAERCEKNGEIGALLRREGLYSSLLSKWRQEASRGGLSALRPKRRGPAPKVVDERDKRIAQLEREIKKERRRSQRAEALIEVQKKVADLLGIVLPENEETK
jgi:transposase-like protein